MTLINVYRGYINAGQKKAWCHDNFLHTRNLEYAVDVRKQLAGLAERANLEKASCGSGTESLRKSLLEGLSDNLAELQRDNTYLTVNIEIKCLISMRKYERHKFSRLIEKWHEIFLDFFFIINSVKSKK